MDLGRGTKATMVLNDYVKRISPNSDTMHKFGIALILCKNFPQGKIHPRSKNLNTSTTIDQKEYDQYLKACHDTCTYKL